jgi:hypothetical protein
VNVSGLIGEGKPFAITHTDNTYGLMIFNSFVVSQAVGGVVSSTVFEFGGVKFCAQLLGNITNNTWKFTAFTLAGADDIPTDEHIGSIVDEKLSEIPDTSGENAVFYIKGGGTTDTTNKVATWTGSHPDITKYYEGLTIAYKVGTAGSTTTTLNINGLGAVSVVRNVTTAVSTAYAVGSIVFLTYTVDDSGTAYWKTADYDANTKTTTGTSNKVGTKMYLAGATSQTSSGTTTYTNINCYIGTNNRLYSGGELVMNNAEITALIQEQLGVIENGSY